MPFHGEWSFKLINTPPVLNVIQNPSTNYVITYGSCDGLSPFAPDTVQILYAHTVTITTQYYVVGDMLITMPNGDTLQAHLEGTANPTAPYVLHIDQLGTITGGTGIFAKARGAFSGLGTVNLATASGSVTMDGWITLHDDNRDGDKVN